MCRRQEIKVSPSGFEPLTSGFGGRGHDCVNNDDSTKLRDTPQGEVPVLVPSPSSAAFSPDLARVVDAWNHIPEAIRTAILALVEVGGAGA